MPMMVMSSCADKVVSRKILDLLLEQKKKKKHQVLPRLLVVSRVILPFLRGHPPFVLLHHPLLHCQQSSSIDSAVPCSKDPVLSLLKRMVSSETPLVDG